MKKLDISTVLDKEQLEKVLEFGNLTENIFECQGLIGLVLEDEENYNVVILISTNSNGFKIFNMRIGFSVLEDAIDSINYQFKWSTEGLGKERMVNFQNGTIAPTDFNKATYATIKKDAETKTSFFHEQKEQSLVKSTIVSKYFKVWANVIISSQNRFSQNSKKIAYIDLFAGPGRYEDGNPSTPIKILTHAISNEDLRERLVTIFNDKDETNSQQLTKIISEIPDIGNLKYKPDVWNQEVGENIVAEFEKMNLVPTLFFVDPWGYKGLSLRLVNSVVKDWGCDAIFFFNYNRINMGINNPLVEKHMEALFGIERCGQLKEKLKELDSLQRELTIIEELCQALKEEGSGYVLPFRFKNDKGVRTSHHLIFVSKHPRGYEIMKDIMARESSSDEQGVPSFEYSPSDFITNQTLLLQLSRPLDDLKDDLLKSFKGRTIKMIDIFHEHHVDTPYIKKNYKNVLKILLEENRIEAISDKGRSPRKGTFGDEINVTFK